jgi:hypothetical protein
MLSELDESVLKAIMLGNRDVEKISKLSGIPPFITEKIIERLLEREYIDLDLEPTEKAYRETKWLDIKHGPSFHGEDVKKIITLVVDLSIAIGLIIFFIAILYFFGFG